MLPSPRGLLVQVSDHTVYRSDTGVGLSLYCSADGFLSHHQLQLHVGRLGPVVEITDAMANRVTGARRPAPAQDLQLALVPIYRRSIDAEGPHGVKELGYLSRPELVGTHLGQLPLGPGQQLSRTPKITYTRVELVMRTFSDKASLIAPFKLSEWPAGEPALSAMLTSTLESFLKVVEHGKRR